MKIKQYSFLYFLKLITVAVAYYLIWLIANYLIACLISGHSSLYPWYWVEGADFYFWLFGVWFGAWGPPTLLFGYYWKKLDERLANSEAVYYKYLADKMVSNQKLIAEMKSKIEEFESNVDNFEMYESENPVK